MVSVVSVEAQVVEAIVEAIDRMAGENRCVHATQLMQAKAPGSFAQQEPQLAGLVGPGRSLGRLKDICNRSERLRYDHEKSMVWVVDGSLRRKKKNGKVPETDAVRPSTSLRDVAPETEVDMYETFFGEDVASVEERHRAPLGGERWYEATSGDAGYLGRLIESVPDDDKHVFLNTSEPFCLVVTGVQGAGKSHTMMCVLENCLLRCELPEERPVVRLAREMTGLVVRYDTCETSVCEATALRESAILPSGCKVVVLVSPSFYSQRRKFYEGMGAEVFPLLFRWASLDARQLKILMRISESDAQQEQQQLYVSAMLDKLRGYQRRAKIPDFEGFLEEIESEFEGRNGPLKQQIALLESIVAESEINQDLRDKQRDLSRVVEAGALVVADLADPVLSALEANAIFRVLFSQFRALRLPFGKVVAFDEAHKYLDGKTSGLAADILDAVRLMRHEGIRVLVSTQSPFAVPGELLELVSVAVVHRAHSNDSFEYLAAKLPMPDDGFERARQMRDGEALVFATRNHIQGFEHEAVFKVRTRPRLTLDYGASRQNSLS
ncbi:hypothetical protein CTAYLR_005122 [Chrysophaeum taylorii]|uniref:Uncharacterized protein n=1 Tax=Chrysophaeum taylorii TaxID=2483200 RepID=A0AAD7XIX5_9STRA|nr:hypothetical protein CTAYLR_005122 [Chrysophaeum taylorii]